MPATYRSKLSSRASLPRALRPVLNPAPGPVLNPANGGANGGAAGFGAAVIEQGDLRLSSGEALKKTNSAWVLFSFRVSSWVRQAALRQQSIIFDFSIFNPSTDGSICILHFYSRVHAPVRRLQSRPESRSWSRQRRGHRRGSMNVDGSRRAKTSKCGILVGFCGILGFSFNRQSSIVNHQCPQSPVTNHQSPITNHQLHPRCRRPSGLTNLIPVVRLFSVLSNVILQIASR